jgi:DNA polymerase IV
MILHVDMDAFYASVEERDQPALVGKPVIVGGSGEGRGVVAAANYAARKFGVHSAMPTSTALRRCPQLVVLPVRMSHYAEVSQQIREIFFRYTPLVEPLSLDEAFLDVTGSELLFGSARSLAIRIKEEIRGETQLIASVGVAPNKFLAKIASDLDKPDGLVVVDPDQVQAFLDPLSIGRLWGVGKVTEKVFLALGVDTIGKLRNQSLESLEARFGSNGAHFWRLARGIDDRLVIPDRDAKSISHESTFSADTADKEVLLARLLDLTEQVARRLRRQQKKAKTVQLKVRFDDFRTITRAKTLPQPSDVTSVLWEVAKGLLQKEFRTSRSKVRLLGIGVSGFATRTTVQLGLFDSVDDDRPDSDTPTQQSPTQQSLTQQQLDKQRRLDAVTDAVRDKFGQSALGRGRSGGRKRKQAP